MTIVPITDLRFELGEGLHWDSMRQCLWGVDIQGCLVWRWTQDTNLTETWSVRHTNAGHRVGWVLPLKDNLDEVLLGLQSGVAIADSNTMSVKQWLQRPFEQMPSMRLNDAKADASGAVWCGSLDNDDESQPLGCLYRLSPQGQWQVIDQGYTVANGPAIDEAQKVLMHTDSGRRTIYQFGLDVITGTVAGKRIWKVFSESEGYPDGMTFDAEGNLWVAHWGAGCISRFALDGSLLSRIQLPTTNITNVCFGGELLDRLFVTSAKVGLNASQRSAEPEAGRVFEVIGHATIGLKSLPAAISNPVPYMFNHALIA